MTKQIHFTAGLLCLASLYFVACKKTSVTTGAAGSDTTHTVPPPPVVTFQSPTYDPSGLDSATAFYKIPSTHNMANTHLPEISGVAASRVNPGILYVHDDSGNPPQVYLTDSTGADRGTLTLTTAGNRDWEDIAVGPGPVAGKSYVYVADIGDNNTHNPSVMIYRFPEPDLAGQSTPFVTSINAVDIITLQYPDGPRNAETLMVDPLSGDLYIASKESNLSKIYVARYPQSTTATTVMTPLVKLLFNKATGGDISSDGQEILLRSNELIWYWRLPAGTSIAEAFMQAPQIAPYADNEPQGEGVGFAADGSGYYTNTENKGYTGKLATISFYRRK